MRSRPGDTERRFGDLVIPSHPVHWRYGSADYKPQRGSGDACRAGVGHGSECFVGYNTDPEKRRNAGARSVALASALAGFLALRAQSLRWGATDAETKMALPGDELMSRAHLTATRAVSIQADADLVWPWIAQLGQGRGGFYSYDFLENAIGCNIHSAAHVMPEFQDITAGDDVRLAPQVSLVVASLEPGRLLVLRGGIPIGNSPPPYDFTWAFTLRDGPGNTTRLLVRERYTYTQPWARMLVEPTEALSFVMSQKMLRGIKDRAERTAGHHASQARTTESSSPDSAAPAV